LAIYQGVLAGALSFLAGILVLNLFTLRKIARGPGPRSTPFVSVLVPARNEGRNIAACLRSILNQTYPSFEILVYDDGSADDTAAIVGQMAREDFRLWLFRGQELPAGWLGKCFACRELAARARGEILLFTDADTVHAPYAVEAALAALESDGAGLLSVVTRLETEGFWEKLILPLVPFIALTYLPFFLAPRFKSDKLAMGNGQFMMFRRSVYESIGGHEAVKDALVEDVWLARRVKKAGFSVSMRDGSGAVSCRMYRGGREIWEGFSKNLFPAFDYSVAGLSAVLLFQILAYVAPYGFVAAGIFFRLGFTDWVLLPSFQIATAWCMRLAIGERFGFGKFFSFLHGFGILALTVIAVNSAASILWGPGAVWKDRTYQFHPVRARKT
jgi:chlorobactene glucosyltransferase